jgi:hypothetical protein
MHIVYADIITGYSDILVLLGLVIGGIIGLVLRYFIFRASCALVDADPSHFKSILIVLFGLAIFLIIVGPMSFFGLGILFVWQSVFLYVLWVFLGVALTWAILGAIYIPAVPVSVGKGFLLSGYEVVLGLLANTLIFALVLVVLAAFQIATNSSPNQGHSVAPAAAANRVL